MYYCDRCGGPIDKNAVTALANVQLRGVECDEADYFEYRLCAPCWYGYRNTFRNKEGE